MKSVRQRLTYANVMSSLAVFLVVAGGSAFAAAHLGKNTVGPRQLKKNAVVTAKIKNGAVTGAKIAPGAVGAAQINTTGLTVPSATKADSATRADSAIRADTATRADMASRAGTATRAESATNAEALGGVAASGYARTQLEAVHYVGQPGQPAFENGCQNLGPEFEPVGFYKDNNGIVHLTGVFFGCSGNALPSFTLPVGFRPANNTLFGGFDIGPGDAVRVDPDGGVKYFGTTEAGLNGDTFRAG